MRRGRTRQTTPRGAAYRRDTREGVTAEHRCLRREPLGLRVELWGGSEWLGCFTTRDVSAEGAFVETGPVDVRPHEVVTVRFRLRAAGSAQNHEVPALVVHRSDEGLGLMYAAFSADFWHDLAAAIKNKAAA